MTAVANGKSTITKSKAKNTVAKNFNENLDDCDSSSSDGSDLKQRKKELIMQKQLERRQQQELIRQQREEERARKAEELRIKEEELAYKKQLEKTRKETIFQAYIDKKKQLQDESQSGYHFGGSINAQNSLMNARKYHSTYRLKQSPSSNNYGQQQKQQLFPDQFDQASIISERSSTLRYNNNNNNPNSNNHISGQHQSQTMIKSKFIFNHKFFFIFNLKPLI
jgi:hypothetical protein